MTQPGSGDTTPVSPDPTHFGVTVRMVQSLLPNAALNEESGGNKAPAGALRITAQNVEMWIDTVAGELSARIAGWEKLTDEPRLAYIRKAGRAVILNGVAYWWEAARSQHRRDHNGSSYAQDLQDRYQDMLDALVKNVEEWLEEGPDGTGGGPSGSFPCARFTDRMQF